MGYWSVAWTYSCNVRDDTSPKLLQNSVNTATFHLSTENAQLHDVKTRKTSLDTRQDTSTALFPPVTVIIIIII